MVATKNRSENELKNIRLIECSCNLLEPELSASRWSAELTYKTDSIPSTGENKGDLSFYIESSVNLKTEEEKREILSLVAKFRVDFTNIEKKIFESNKIADFQDEQARRLFPVARSFLTDILIKMGYPIFIPWHMPKRAGERKQKKSQ